jgi:N-methylhydantoinase B
VIRNALTEVTEEMSVTLRRSAYSTNIKTRADFSCALFDRDLQAVAQAFTQANHLGSLTLMVPRIVREYGAEKLEPGDALLSNDPYRGGAHLNDILLVSPIFTRASASPTSPTWRITSMSAAGRRPASGPSARSTRRA